MAVGLSYGTATTGGDAGVRATDCKPIAIAFRDVNVIIQRTNRQRCYPGIEMEFLTGHWLKMM